MKYLRPTFFLLIYCGLLHLNVKANDFFQEGKEFKRSASSVYLKYSSQVQVNNYGFNLIKPGFYIYTYDVNPNCRRQVGYISYEYDTDDKRIEVSWVKINEKERGKGYAFEGLQTFIGIIKKHSNRFSEATHYFLTTGRDNQAMIKVARKLGFEESNRFFHPNFMIDFEKEIAK